MENTLLKMRLSEFVDSQAATLKSRFFRCGEGEYGYGDQFLGITVPQTRKLVSEFYTILGFEELGTLLKSVYHEERLLALLVLVKQYQKGDQSCKSEIYSFYLEHKSFVNNWDLVDSSAFQIVGDYEMKYPTTLLHELAQSESLWDRRIAIIATFSHIKASQFEIPLVIATILLNDSHDLIHKAVGWMIREIWNRSPQTAITYLLPVYRFIPRTMLRYAIEKFPEVERQKWLKGLI